MKSSRLPGEGGDRQRQMGNPETGPGLKMDRRCLRGPLGLLPICSGEGLESVLGRGTEQGGGQRWCRLWAIPDPTAGGGTAARGHTEAVGARVEVWSGGGVGLQPGRPPEVWQSHNLSGGLAKDPVGQG